MKDLEADSADGVIANLRGGRKGPTSVAQYDENNQLIENSGDYGSNMDQDMANADNQHDNESEPVALKQPYVIPSCSQWFDFDLIHEIEYDSLPEFFCEKYPSKTPESYKEYRNFMVKLYRENPTGYLSATTCRRHLAGDACAIIR